MKQQILGGGGYDGLPSFFGSTRCPSCEHPLTYNTRQGELIYVECEFCEGVANKGKKIIPDILGDITNRLNLGIDLLVKLEVKELCLILVYQGSHEELFDVQLAIMGGAYVGLKHDLDFCRIYYIPRGRVYQFVIKIKIPSLGGSEA